MNGRIGEQVAGDTVMVGGSGRGLLPALLTNKPPKVLASGYPCSSSQVRPRPLKASCASRDISKAAAEGRELPHGGSGLSPQKPSVLPWPPLRPPAHNRRPDTAPQENSRTHLETLVLHSLQMMKQRVRGERALLGALTLLNTERGQKERAWCGAWYVASVQVLDSEHSAQPSCSLLILPGATCMESESFLEAYQAPKGGFQNPRGHGDPTQAPARSQKLQTDWLVWKSALAEI